jgi:beta-glucanase (GH16 family)
MKSHRSASSRHISKKSMGALFLAPLLLTACGSLSQLQSPGTSAPVASSLSTTQYPTATSPASSSDSSKFTLTWKDDFSGSGSPQNWKFDVGGYGFGDKQLQWNGEANAQLSAHDGLAITATKGGGGEECWYGACQYTSAKIETTFAQQYGRFEARIKLPGGTGLWPAFWMVPAAAAANPGMPGEIDVIEVNNSNPFLVSGYEHDANTHNYRAAKVLTVPASSSFHTYGVDWTPSGITWTLDGQPYGHISAYPNWPFDQPFIMILDLAVGGSWPGSPDASTKFPAQMDVSWVRVYKLADLLRPPGSNFSKRPFASTPGSDRVVRRIHAA